MAVASSTRRRRRACRLAGTKRSASARRAAPAVHVARVGDAGIPVAATVAATAVGGGVGVAAATDGVVAVAAAIAAVAGDVQTARAALSIMCFCGACFASSPRMADASGRCAGDDGSGSDGDGWVGMVVNAGAAVADAVGAIDSMCFFTTAIDVNVRVVLPLFTGAVDAGAAFDAVATAAAAVAAAGAAVVVVVVVVAVVAAVAAACVSESVGRASAASRSS